MTKRYESLSEVLNVLRKRRIQASLEEVESVLRRLGLREPFGPEDVAELVTHLQPQHTVSRRIMKTARVLSSREWADAVLAVRLELGLPSTGLSEEAARKLHKALLDTLVGELPTLVKIGARDWQPVHLVWRDLVAASRRLCTLLGIDPRLLDDLRATYASGSASTHLGVRKLLNPEGIFKFGGRN